MSRKSLEKRLIFAVIVASVINIFILLLWFFIRVNPIISNLQEFKSDIINKEIKEEYNNLDNLNKDIKKTSSKHDLIIIVEDIDGRLVYGKKLKTDIALINKVVMIDNKAYLLRLYFDNKISVKKIIKELLTLQIVVMLIILIITFLYTREMILKPINSLISDIRNYKLGKKIKRRKLHNELDLIVNEFANLTDRLDKEKREQTRIIASISHDIKTPLTSIIGYSNLLKEQNLDKDTYKYNQKINDRAIDIKEILETFDDYLLNEENVSLDKSIIQIKDLVHEINNDYKIELDNKGIEFTLVTDVEDEYINIDLLKMKRVLSNMIQNSTRYLKDNGMINIEITKDKDNYIFLVSDNGPGVDKNIIDKIFDPLFTTDSSRKISGLGLSICREFIEMHGGNIKAYNNNGLVIEFTIPR